jgi:hypothetical protein
MSYSFTGGCACGAIRYECTGEPLFSLNCHCRDCQRETGSAYAPILGVLRATFTITQGSPQYFELVADSGHRTKRAFCTKCGARLFGEPGVAPDVVTIRVGSLDDPSGFQPGINIYTASAQPWDYMSPDLPTAAKDPQMQKP